MSQTSGTYASAYFQPTGTKSAAPSYGDRAPASVDSAPAATQDSGTAISNSTALVTAGYGIQAFASLASGYSNYKAIKAKDRYDRMQSEWQARFLELQGQDALSRGDIEAASVIRKSRQIAGAQKSSFARQGVDVSYGTAQEVQDQSYDAAEADYRQIKNNAWREAWGYETQAALTRSESKFRSLGAQAEARSTLVAGGLQALGYGLQAGAYYNRYRKEVELEKTESEKAKNPVAEQKAFVEGEYKKNEEKKKGYKLSKDNPLFPGKKLTSSWWRMYNEGE